MATDWSHFMRLAVRAARKGYGNTGPNPRVGAVVVRGSGVVGTGYHRKVGDAHAEVMALQNAGPSASGADMVVTLEPCSRHGRTPPCVDSIVAAGIKRVIVGLQDPNPEENGRGLARLREAGVEVLVGVEEELCRGVNEAYLKTITTGLPFVTLKLAVSVDGRIATGSGDARWISSSGFGRFVHRLRRDANAVMVGWGTVLADDPSLTVRLARPRTNPLRVAVSSTLEGFTEKKLFLEQQEHPTLVLTTQRASPEILERLALLGVRTALVPLQGGRLDLKQALQRLVQFDVSGVLVEGGGVLAGSLITHGLVDRLIVAHAPVIVGSRGRPSVDMAGFQRLADAPRWKREWTRTLGEDVVESLVP
jgi:diaminohydroxyphosphoribosylaminopyrimidine deaminase / 5-amino-6-(5-phosphoribosylamino)uracil reductase